MSVPAGPKYHVMLIPQESYWDWVQAARDFAVHFQVSLTPRPENAAAFHAPDQAVTVVDAPRAYSGHSPIARWFSDNASDVPLDIVSVTSPAQLRQILTSRIEQEARYGQTPLVTHAEAADATASFRLVWPTDYPVTTQAFGANPDLYRQFGLPGHEGLDIRAPFNANVYACADGAVYQVHDGTGGHPYGIHVRIRHADGYKTVYGHLNQALVHTGQVVLAGDLIGLADSTGNSTGSHLHLTLKKDGASAAGATAFPHDIIDPTPFMVPRTASAQGQGPAGDWPYDHCLVGVRGRVGAALADADWSVIRTARIEALKLTNENTSGDVVRAHEINPDLIVLVQLTANLQGRPTTARQFVGWIRNDVHRYYEKGVRYFEVHRQPNLTVEGYGSSWQNGEDFGRWFLEVVGMLRPDFPEARFGWPGLSNGPTTAGLRFDSRTFLESAIGTVHHADWIGCNCHWRDEMDMFSEEGGLAYLYYQSQWPDRLLLITEFSNPAADIPLHLKGNQYLQYYRHLRSEAGVGAAFASVLSSSSGYQNEVWRTESGTPTPIVAAVASRADT